MTWSDKELTGLTITSTKGGSCSVRTNEAKQLRVISECRAVSCTVENGVYTFDTVKGAVYMVTSADTNLEAVRNAEEQYSR